MGSGTGALLAVDMHGLTVARSLKVCAGCRYIQSDSVSVTLSESASIMITKFTILLSLSISWYGYMGKFHIIDSTYWEKIL